MYILNNAMNLTNLAIHYRMKISTQCMICYMAY